MGKILDQTLKVKALLDERDWHRVIRITPTIASEPLPVTASKFGGVPYLPEGVDAPTNADGDSLGMVAQINCAELPDNDIYPQTGILQFWLDPTDDMNGLGGDNPIEWDGNCVIYYPELGAPNADAGIPHLGQEDVNLPITPEDAEFALSFEVIEQGEAILSEDFFDDFVDQWNALYPDQTIEDFSDVDDLSDESVTDSLYDYEWFHKIGGNPFYVQGDPRNLMDDFMDDAKDRAINLLTMISETFYDPQVEQAGEYPYCTSIMWGDLGSGNWLIMPEHLAARDFSRVFYDWACG